MDARNEINTTIYNDLGERWYTAKDDPIALLRAETRFRNPWVQRQILERLGSAPQKILDVGCGAGFLSGFLAQAGHSVTGLDQSAESLEVARRHDRSGTTRYVEGDALRMPFETASFDVICAMDFLEHVEELPTLLAEISRVLIPGGLFFFYTFNRNWVSRLVIIKAVEWFVKNTPKNLHLYPLFVRPEELRQKCAAQKLVVESFEGVRPVFSSALFKMLLTGCVPDDFSFKSTSSLMIGYQGVAIR